MDRKRKRGYREMLIPDPLLLSRLNKYLEAKKHEVTIDQNKMVEDLRSNYKEYERKDKTAFRARIFRAYNYILHPLLNPSSIADNDDASSVESCSNEEEILDSDNMDDGDEIEVLESEDSFRRKNKGNVSYLQNLQNMTNSSSRMDSKKTSSEGESNGKKTVEDAIAISSDDEEEISNNKEPSPPAPAPVKVAPVTKTIFKPAHVTFSRGFNKTVNSRNVGFSGNALSITVKPHAPALTSTPYLSPKKRKLTSAFAFAKRRKDYDHPPVDEPPKFRLKDFGGHQKILENLNALFQHMKCPEVYCTLGVNPPLGFLLHGPPGTGKSLLAHCIAGELNLPLLKVIGPELVSGISGESEERIRSLFESAASSAPCVLFIDEIDAITQPRDGASKDMERRIVAQLLASFDELQARPGEDLVIVIGATNRADSLDPALRRAGRFDREIIIGMPDRPTRVDILKLLCDSLKLAAGVKLEEIAAVTPGYVGADLKALTAQAAYQAVDRYMKFKDESTSVSKPNDEDTVNKPKEGSEEDKEEKGSNDINSCEKDGKEDEQGHTKDKEDSNRDDIVTITIGEASDPLDTETLDGLFIEHDDFLKALKFIQPSAKREGFATVPDVTWSDVGALDDIREQLNLSIMMPVKYPEEFAKLGVTSPSGVLLCGPPGCGKTLLAKAIANEANINFISVKGPELLNMYVGESEKAVRQVFQRARNSQPCVIFFDEIDALCPQRSDSSEGGGRAGSRVVNQLLTEMDGVEGGRFGVYMMAATNRPDILDPAILRPGRFDKQLYMGLPSPKDRVLILKAITKNGTKPEFSSDVDLEAVGSSDKCDGFSGADLAALVKEASVQALCEYIKNNRVGDLSVSSDHINKALTKVKSSVSPLEREKYKIYEDLNS